MDGIRADECADPVAMMSPRLRSVLSMGGAVTAFLGLLVLAGWLLGLDRVTAVQPGLDPMPFNTALGFTLLGLAQLGLAGGRTRLATAAAAGAALFGLLTILQHLFDHPLYLDTLFFAPVLEGPGPTGRGSPNAGLAFLLAGVGLMLVTRRGIAALLSAALLGAASLTIAAVDLLGYPLSTQGHDGAFVLPQMALHAALGISLVGLVLLHLAWRIPGGLAETRYARGGLAIGIVVAFLSVLLAQLLRSNERKQIRGTVQVAAQGIADQIERNLDGRVATMLTITRAWGAVTPSGWDSAARAIVDGGSSRRGLGWIDAGGGRRWLALSAGSPDLGRSPWWPDSLLLAQAAEAGGPMLSVGRNGGGMWLGVVAPASTRQGRGYLWSVSDIDQALGGELGGITGQFSVVVTAGGDELVRHASGPEELERLWSARAEVSHGPVHWLVTAWPTPLTLREARSTLPILTLSAGMLVAVLLGLALTLSRAAHQRAGEIAAAHARLTTEIQEREAAEAALRRSEEQLQQAQKLEAVGRLAGGIAHDYNNILTVIRGNARTLLLQDGTADLTRDALEHIDRAAARGSLLTARLLAFSQRQLLQPEPLSLAEVLHSLRDELAALLGPHVQLALDLHPGEDQVHMDRRWLGQVVLDLGFNAREAMPLGGVLTIRTRAVTEELRTRYAARDLGPAMLLEIEDSGRGMDESTRGRLFEPFFSTKKFGQGAGLALASAYGIIRQSGGDIQVRSVPDHGTRIGIFLPLAAAVAPRPEPALPGGTTVLVAEDEAGILRFLRRTLEGAGCRVVAGGSAEDALAALEESGATPDLLVSDIVMPGQSGVELAEQLRQRYPALAVLFASAYTSDALKERGIESLGAYLLQKPFTAEELLGQVSRTLAQRSAGIPAR